MASSPSTFDNLHIFLCKVNIKEAKTRVAAKLLGSLRENIRDCMQKRAEVLSDITETRRSICAYCKLKMDYLSKCLSRKRYGLPVMSRHVYHKLDDEKENILATLEDFENLMEQTEIRTGPISNWHKQFRDEYEERICWLNSVRNFSDMENIEEDVLAKIQPKIQEELDELLSVLEGLNLRSRSAKLVTEFKKLDLLKDE